VIIMHGLQGGRNIFGKKYSIVILLENAGSGGSLAAPIAKLVFKKIINDKLIASK